MAYFIHIQVLELVFQFSSVERNMDIVCYLYTSQVFFVFALFQIFLIVFMLVQIMTVTYKRISKKKVFLLQNANESGVLYMFAFVLTEMSIGKSHFFQDNLL